MTINDSGEITIPRWAQWVGGGVAAAVALLLTAAVPWAWDVAASLTEIKTQLAGQVRITEIEVSHLRVEINDTREDLRELAERLRAVERLERRANKPPAP